MYHQKFFLNIFLFSPIFFNRGLICLPKLDKQKCPYNELIKCFSLNSTELEVNLKEIEVFLLENPNDISNEYCSQNTTMEDLNYAEFIFISNILMYLAPVIILTIILIVYITR